MNTVPLDQIEGYIWIDGEFVEWKEAKVHLLTNSLHYSGSVFEGCRIYNGKVFKLEEHIERLFMSAKIMKLDIDFTFSEVLEACKLVVQKNHIESGYLRPLIWRGSQNLKIGAVGNKIHVMLAVWSLSGNEFFEQKSLKLCVSKWVKPADNAIPVQCKSAGNYTMLIVSKYEAYDSGFDDAIMLDMQGFIAECTAANIFFVKGNILYTPTTKYALNGITRQIIMQIAQEKGLEVIEANLRVSDIEGFDECFMTGTAAEVKSIGLIQDGEKKIIFAKNDITAMLAGEYRNLTRNS